MAHHRSGGTGRAIILHSKRAAECCLYAQYAKKIAVYIETFGITRFSSVDQIETRRAPGDKARERLLALLNLLPLGVGKIRAAARPPARASLIFVEINRDQFLPILDRQQSEPDLLYHVAKL